MGTCGYIIDAQYIQSNESFLIFGIIQKKMTKRNQLNSEFYRNFEVQSERRIKKYVAY